MKKSVLLIFTLIMILGSTGSVFAQTLTMILRDNEAVWVDVNSKEAKDYFARVNAYTLPPEELEREVKSLNKKIIESEPKVVRADPTSEKITVDGKPASFRAYNIGGYNYFMLRDLAHIFNGTMAQFEVLWDQSKQGINLKTNTPYTGKGEGFDMKTPHVAEKGYKSRATIYKNGKESVMLAYTIKGNTYFKLRDLGDEMGFGVKWDDKSKTLVLLSDKDAEIPVITPDPVEVADKEEEWDPFKDYNPFGTTDVDKSKVTGTTEAEKDQMAKEMLVLVNKARKEAGVKPLVLDSNLVKMSKYKAKDMQERGFAGHDGSYGSALDLARMFNESSIGENVHDFGLSPEHMFNIWWESPGHRANMLNPDVTRFGFAIAEKEANTVGTEKEFSDLTKYVYDIQYNKITGLYQVTGMTYFAVQHFGF